MTGSVRVGDRIVKLDRARGDVLIATAERDNVVPAAATEPAVRFVGDPTRREELRLPGGHVTFGTGRSAFKHTMPLLAEWITAHSDQRADCEEA
jgi:poly(3-hydroxyalkanoate) synthetase